MSTNTAGSQYNANATNNVLYPIQFTSIDLDEAALAQLDTKPVMAIGAVDQNHAIIILDCTAYNNVPDPLFPSVGTDLLITGQGYTKANPYFTSTNVISAIKPVLVRMDPAYSFDFMRNDTDQSDNVYIETNSPISVGGSGVVIRVWFSYIIMPYSL